MDATNVGGKCRLGSYASRRKAQRRALRALLSKGSSLSRMRPVTRSRRSVSIFSLHRYEILAKTRRQQLDLLRTLISKTPSCTASCALRVPCQFQSPDCLSKPPLRIFVYRSAETKLCLFAPDDLLKLHSTPSCSDIHPQKALQGLAVMASTGLAAEGRRDSPSMSNDCSAQTLVTAAGTGRRGAVSMRTRSRVAAPETRR